MKTEIDRIIKFCENRLADSQVEELYNWIKESEDNKLLFSKIKNFYAENNIYKSKRISKRERARVLEEIYRHQGWYLKYQHIPTTLHHIIQASIMAAVVLVVVVATIQINRYSREQAARAYLSENAKSIESKAILTLSDGKTIQLGEEYKKDQSKKYEVEDDGSKVRIQKKTETKKEPASNTTNINRVSTEMGGFYNIIMPDSSEIWINSKSTISFDDNYGKKERLVILSGEAFFTVTPMENNPFIVEVKGNRVSVLGTEFNLKAYSSEPILRLSLVKGSVKFSDNVGTHSHILSPERELIYNYENKEVFVRAFDPYEFKALKNGYFFFKNQNLDEIITKISRWFNLEISLENNEYNTRLFNGKISRENGIMPLMDKLQLSYKFRYFMQNDTLIIK